MSENDMKPESPKEVVNCDSKEEEEEEAVNSSGECDRDSSQATAKEERENTDEIIGVELDYEEEVCFERDDKDKKSPCPDKKDEIELEKRSNDEPDDDDDDDDEKDKKSETQQSQDTKDGEKEDDIEEGEDEGEISDGDDLEEGELKDASPKPEATRQVCRFYGRGQCFYGNACRFLHLNHEKGQYSMFAPPRYSPGYAYGPPVSPMISDRSGPRMSGEFMNVVPVPMQAEPSPVESAWERGLREAKELVKKANKRKEEEPDFDKKKLNLSIHVNERNTPDYDKENDYFSRSYAKRNDTPYKKYDEPVDIYDNDARAAREHFRGGRYENFEIRYTRGEREDMPRDRRARERSHTRGRMSSEREHKYPSKENRHKDRLKDDRMFDIQMRNRAFHYIDPWRRSKTPKARRTRSRSGSYSSVSSYSYSDRTSRSSSGYSRSSSRSSCASSRSPSPVMHKRKTSPTADAGLSPKAGVNRFAMIKKKPANRPGASTSRSRSVSRTPSISRSRSSSISMDSVSSASSSVSSSASESLRNRNSHMSLLRKKTEDKLPLDKLENSRNLPYDREQPDRDQNSMYPDAPVEREAAQPFPSFQHLLPGNDVKAKSQHKQQIKLTLLNKPTTSKAANFPKKELDRSKLLTDQKDSSSKSDVLGYSSGAPKRPLSPTLSAMNSKPNPLVPKKSASSRRDELLKQLKAVEDAIARKRAKFC